MSLPPGHRIGLELRLRGGCRHHLPAKWSAARRHSQRLPLPLPESPDSTFCMPHLAVRFFLEDARSRHSNRLLAKAPRASAANQPMLDAPPPSIGRTPQRRSMTRQAYNCQRKHARQETGESRRDSWAEEILEGDRIVSSHEDFRHQPIDGHCPLLQVIHTIFRAENPRRIATLE